MGVSVYGKRLFGRIDENVYSQAIPNFLLKAFVKIAGSVSILKNNSIYVRMSGAGKVRMQE